MPFLTVNGFTFPVKIGSSGRSVSRRGKRRRAFRGQMRDAERGKRSDLRFSTCFDDFDTAKTFEHILNGEGHVVYFRDGLQASTGLNPEIIDLSGSGFEIARAGPFPGFDGGTFSSDAGAIVMRYDAQLCDEWTILWAEESFTDNTWRFLSRRHDGAFWQDGVRVDTQWLNGRGVPGEWEVTVRNGKVELASNGADGGALHHLVILPFHASDDFVEAFGTSTKPWGPMPALRVEGDALQTDHEFFFGRVKSIDYITVPSTVDGWGRISNGALVQFELEAIASAFVADDSVKTQGSV